MNAHLGEYVFNGASLEKDRVYIWRDFVDIHVKAPDEYIGRAGRAANLPKYHRDGDVLFAHEFKLVDGHGLESEETFWLAYAPGRTTRILTEIRTP